MSEDFNEKAATWDASEERIHRAEIVARRIKETLNLQKGYSALDFGCGTGLLGMNFVEDAGSFLFIDTSTAMIDQVKEKLSGKTGQHASAEVKDILNETLDQPFDLILSLMALHHVDNHKKVLQELSRSLNPGGSLCIADLVSEDGSFHGGKEVPHRGFDTDDLGEILEDCGLFRKDLSIPYINEKNVDGERLQYPVFLLIYQKPEKG